MSEPSLEELLALAGQKEKQGQGGKLSHEALTARHQIAERIKQRRKEMGWTFANADKHGGLRRGSTRSVEVSQTSSCAKMREVLVGLGMLPEAPQAPAPSFETGGQS